MFLDWASPSYKYEELINNWAGIGRMETGVARWHVERLTGLVAILVCLALRLRPVVIALGIGRE
jgi:hypothetical protein